MASYQIFDTYKAYKAKEKKLTGWLRETIQSLGPSNKLAV